MRSFGLLLTGSVLLVILAGCEDEEPCCDFPEVTCVDPVTHLCERRIDETECEAGETLYADETCPELGYRWICDELGAAGTNPVCAPVPPPERRVPSAAQIPWLDSGDSPAAPPAAPATPDAGTCPAGWTMRGGSADGYTSCEPWPTTGIESCTGAAVHLPGTAGCAALGPSCPADGRFVVDGVAALYVRPGASGGDGSVASPFGSLAEAFAAASASTRVRLEAGDHPVAAGGLSIPDGVHLEGVCTGAVVRGQLAAMGAATLENLTLAPDTDGAGLVATGASALTTLRNVRVTGGTRPVQALMGARVEAIGLLVDGAVRAGVVSSDGASVTLGDFALLGVEGNALDASGGTAQLSRGLVSGTNETRATAGVGLSLTDGAVITSTAVVLEGNTGRGVDARDAGSELTADYLVVRDTEPGFVVRPGGYALYFDRGASGMLSHTLIERSRGAALRFHGGARVQLTDAVLLDTLEDADERGLGIEGFEGECTLSRVLIAGSVVAGLAMGDSLLDASDLVVRDTAAAAAGGFSGVGIEHTGEVGAAVLSRVEVHDSGQGIRVENGSLTDVRVQRSLRGPGIRATGQVAFSRVHVEESQDVGIAYRVLVRFPGEGAPERIEMSDVTVRGADGPGTTAPGFFAQGGVTVFYESVGFGLMDEPPAYPHFVLRNVSVENVRGAGILIDEDGDFRVARPTLELEDTRVSNVSAEASGEGVGIRSRASSSLTLSRVAVTGPARVGVQVSQEAEFELTPTVNLVTRDLVIRDVEDPGEIAFGLAIEDLGEALTFWRGERLEVTGTRGVGIYGTGPVRGWLTDVVVDATCEDCRDPNIGIGSYQGAGIEVNAFLVTGHNFCGVQAAVGGLLEVEGGEIALNDNGACIDDESYPVEMLSREVLYRDNRVNVGGQSLVPPPPPGPPSGGGG